MIIEISGLPEGQKINRINVDISFIDNQPSLKVDTFVDLPTISYDTTERTIKDIPKEMTDMEF